VTIIEAMKKALADKKYIRRPTWRTRSYLCMDYWGAICLIEDEKRYPHNLSLDVVDILANDWEVSKEIWEDEENRSYVFADTEGR